MDVRDNYAAVSLIFWGQFGYDGGHFVKMRYEHDNRIQH